jgi:hypothetical protein
MTKRAILKRAKHCYREDNCLARILMDVNNGKLTKKEHYFNGGIYEVESF